MTPGGVQDTVQNAWRWAAFLVTLLTNREGEKAACGALYDGGSWLDAPVTIDQMRIERYLNTLPLEGRTVLHVGVGSSHLAKGFHHRCRAIDGLTVIDHERRHAESLGIPNYRVYLMDKHSEGVRARAARQIRAGEPDDSSAGQKRGLSELRASGYGAGTTFEGSEVCPTIAV